MIAESIAFLAGRGKRVLFDAEHFFEGHGADRDYALACLRAAAEAGAERLVLCDTNGGTLPGAIAAAVGDVVAALPDVYGHMRCASSRSRRRHRRRHGGVGCGATGSTTARRSSPPRRPTARRSTRRARSH